MFNAQFHRVITSVYAGLSDRGLPVGTAEQVIDSVIAKEVAHEVAVVTNRIQCQAARMKAMVFPTDQPNDEPLKAKRYVKAAVPKNSYFDDHRD